MATKTDLKFYNQEKPENKESSLLSVFRHFRQSLYSCLQFILLSQSIMLAISFNRISATWQPMQINRGTISGAFLADYRSAGTHRINFHKGNLSINFLRSNQINPISNCTVNYPLTKMTSRISSVINSRQQHTKGNKKREENFFHDNLGFVVKKFVATKQQDCLGAGVSTKTKDCIKIVSG